MTPKQPKDLVIVPNAAVELGAAALKDALGSGRGRLAASAVVLTALVEAGWTLVPPEESVR